VAHAPLPSWHVKSLMNLLQLVFYRPAQWWWRRAVS